MRANRHPLTVQMELALAENMAGTSEFSFTHRSFCIAGLPIRRPPKHDGPTANYLRKGNGYDLHLMTPNWTIPNTNIDIPVGVPFGPKVRLLLIWLASQSQTQGPDIEIDSINSWLDDIGIAPSGKAHSLTKEQLLRLCLTTFRITVTQFGENKEYFGHEAIVESASVNTDDLLYYRDGLMDKMRWPKVVLTQKAWSRFREESVPIPKARLREIAASAPAIDIFLYLSFKLPTLHPGEKHLMTWQQLSAQFGGSPTERLPVSRIKDNLGAALEAVFRAYPEAKLEIVDDGIVMRHSAPPELSTTMVSMNGLQFPETLRLKRKVKDKLIA